MFWDGTQWVKEPGPAPAHPQSRLVTWAATAVMIIGFAGLVLPMQLAAARTSSSVWVVELSGGTTLSSPSALRFADPFTVGYTSTAKEPWALAQCYPNDTTTFSGTYGDGTIWAEWYSVYPGGPAPQDFILGESVSPLWTGGGADCTVTLAKLSGKYNGAQGYSNVTVLATTSFVVAP